MFRASVAMGVTASACFVLACSDSEQTAGGSDTGGNPASGGESAGGSSSGGENSGAAGGGVPTGGSPSSGGSGGGSEAADPNQDGPFATASFSGEAAVPATGNDVPISGWAPTSGGPFPVVIIAHGFQLPASQYDSYAQRLASFGYVAVTPDYPTSFFGLSHVDVAEDLLGSLDWALAEPSLAGKVDEDLVGMAGHSLGGKASLLAATLDPRVKAVIALDPVDSSMSCSPQDCPDVSNLMPTLAIPTGFLGETLDSAGGFQPCAPAADNFQTFYAGATSPSFSVTVLGANHMSFLDDVASCGFTCSFCNAATLDNATVNAMARAYVTAFFERHLRGDAGYDTYLTGAIANQRYVSSGQATIASK